MARLSLDIEGENINFVNVDALLPGAKSFFCKALLSIYQFIKVFSFRKLLLYGVLRSN